MSVLRRVRGLFLQYEVELLHYVQLSGDVDALTSVYDYEYCTGCIKIREGLAGTLVDGHRIRGGKYTITDINFVIFEVPATDGKEPYWLVEVSHTRSPVAQVNISGRAIYENSGEEGTRNIRLTFRGGKWWAHSISIKK